MSELREAAQAVLNDYERGVSIVVTERVIARLRAALAQPEAEAEPVAWQVKKGDDMSTLREAAQAAPDAEVRAQHKKFARWFLELSDKSALASEYLAWLAWKAALAHPPRNEWREAAEEALRWMEHARLHLTIKERMHPDGLSLYDSAAEALRAALAKPETDAGVSWDGHNVRGDADSIAEVRRLIDFEDARQGAKPASEPQEVTVLPDGSAFGVMSFPLPIDHWLCREREYLPGKDEPVDLPKPILTHALCEHVEAAVRYAVRGATNCGKELDFDPDALVLNAVYALCGPYGGASLRDIEPPTESTIAAKCQRIEGSGEICGLTPPCPDCGSSLIDVPEGSL